MKAVKVALFLIIMTFQPIKAQNLDGFYSCDNQNIKINGTHIAYKLISYGNGLHTIFEGTGKIDIRNNRLFIKPDNIEPSQLSTIKKLKPVNNDTMFISIHGHEPNQVIISLFKKNNELYTTMSDTTKRKGVVPRNMIIDCDSIYIGIIGYKEVGLKINNVNEFDYEVELYPDDLDDLYHEFVTNYGHGFRMKVTSNILCLKYERMVNHREKQKWNRFKRMK